MEFPPGISIAHLLTDSAAQPNHGAGGSASVPAPTYQDPSGGTNPSDNGDYLEDPPNAAKSSAWLQKQTGYESYESKQRNRKYEKKPRFTPLYNPNQPKRQKSSGHSGQFERGGSETIFNFTSPESSGESPSSIRDNEALPQGNEPPPTSRSQETPDQAIEQLPTPNYEDAQNEVSHVLTPSTLTTSLPESLITRALQTQVDAIDVLRLLVYLGKNDITKEALLRGTKPCLSFDRNGSVVGIFSEGLKPAFSCVHRLELAITHLLSNNFIISTSEQLSQYAVRGEARSFVEEETKNRATESKVDATKFICHTFPKNPDAEPFTYVPAGRSQLPHAQHILEFLETLDPSSFAEHFSELQQRMLVEFCLSISNFSLAEWKRRAVTVGEKVNLLLQDGLISARLSLRRRELLRAFPDDGAIPLSLSQKDAVPAGATNAFLTENMLLEVQLLIDHNKLECASSELDKWKPSGSSELSKILGYRVDFLKVKVFRFSGRFELSEKLLEKLLSSHCTRIAPYVFSTYVAVLCEQNRILPARNLFRFQECGGDNRYESWEFPARERRLELASAQIDLMEGLWDFKSKMDASHPCLQSSKCQFEKLEGFYKSVTHHSLSSSLNHFSVLAGLAIIEHIQCELDTSEGQLDRALRRWEACWQFVQDQCKMFHWGDNFTHAIICYSQSHIMQLQGREEEAKGYALKAAGIYGKTGCQTFWLGLGTVWFSIITNMVERDGGYLKLCPPKVMYPSAK